jgi:hypothetical protein
LRDDAIAEYAKLGSTRQAEAGDVASGQAYQPFDETGSESRLSVNPGLDW